MQSTVPAVHPLELERVELIARELALRASPRQLPPGHERRWVQLAATDTYDAWLIAWPPGTRLGLHDHGGSSAAVQIVAGELEERSVDAGRSDVVHVRWLAAGDAVAFGPDHVHSMGNDGHVEAVSVHVYSPPLRHMSYFD